MQRGIPFSTRGFFAIIGLVVTLQTLAAVAEPPQPISAPASPTPSPNALVIQVAGVHSVAGKVCIDVFGSKDGWPEAHGKAVKRACLAPSNGQALVVFKDLPAGEYAAFAVHDEDGNGVLLKNWIGMPKEGVGASNNAGGMGGPSFNAAKFTHAGGKTPIRLHLKYL